MFLIKRNDNQHLKFGYLGKAMEIIWQNMFVWLKITKNIHFDACKNETLYLEKHFDKLFSCILAKNNENTH